MSQTEVVIYVSPVHFPPQSAAAQRILGNAQSISQAGFKVLIGGGQQSDTKEIIQNGQIEIHPVSDGGYQNATNFFTKVVRYVMIGRRTVHWLSSLDVDIKAVFIYGGYSFYLIRLLLWRNSIDIPLVFDAVEWYTPQSKHEWFWKPYYWTTEFAMRFLIPKTKNLITISSFLQNYYADCCTCIRVPPLIDMASMEYRVLRKPRNIRIVSYTGSPGHKDSFNNLLESFMIVNESEVRVKFRIAGLTVDQILTYDALQKRALLELPSFLIAEGRVDRMAALAITRDSDFSILQRKESRVSRSGFPTKIVESLAVGTPVITNLTSDLGDFIFDEKEGVIVKDHTVPKLVEALIRASQLPSKHLDEMRKYARLCALNHFDPSKYERTFKEFIDKL